MVFFKPLSKLFSQARSQTKVAQEAPEDSSLRVKFNCPTTHGTTRHETRQALTQKAIEAVVQCQVSKYSGHPKIVFKKQHTLTIRQSTFVATSHAVNTTLAEANPFRKSHDLANKPDESDCEVDIEGKIVHDWSAVEEEHSSESSNPACALKESLHDSNLTLATEQDTRSIEPVQVQVPISATLTFCQPRTYLNIAPPSDSESEDSTLVDGKPAVALPVKFEEKNNTGIQQMNVSPISCIGISGDDIDVSSTQVPVSEAKNDEKGQLQEALHRQESLCQVFRLQLVDCEDRLDSVSKKLQDVEHQCEMYAQESEQTDHKVNKLQKDLAATKCQLAAEKSKLAPAFQPQQQVTNPVPGLDAIAMREALNRAQTQAQAAQQDSKYVRGMLNAVIKERDSLQAQLQFSRHTQNDANMIAHLRDAIDGLNGQVRDLLQQKEEAYERVRVVEGYNRNLLSEYQIEHATNPQAHHIAGNCLPNELQDLRNTLEMSQSNHAKAVENNATLQEMIEQKDKDLAVLRSDRRVFEDNVHRFATAHTIRENILNNFMAGVPFLVQSLVGMNIGQIPGCQELLQECERETREKLNALRDAADKTALATWMLENAENLHKTQVDAFTAEMGRLKAINIELEAQHFRDEDINSQLEQTIQGLRDEVQSSEAIAEAWRTHAEQQTFGPAATDMRDVHQHELDNANNQVEAVQWKCQELSMALDQAREQSLWCRLFYAKKMEGIRMIAYERDYYRQKMDALQERFEDDLKYNPVVVPFKPSWEALSEQAKELIRKGDDSLILKLTGFDMETNLERNPEVENRTVDMVLSELVSVADQLEARRQRLWEPQPQP